ncbi:MAG: HD domain-containing phosphohydrolase [Nitrospira sp.]
MSDSILFVDDETNVLEGFKRQLRKEFTVDTAIGPEEGLKAIAERGPFAVVVSDRQMPGMDGVVFLSKVREQSPDTVRILFTGYANLEAAVQAINEGQIFRFLTKPCAPDVLINTLTAALQQHKLITAERELLEQTLSGSIRVLCDMLSFANPEAFGRSSRITRSVQEMADLLRLPDPWLTTTAAMLSQIGCVILPEIVLDKVYRGETLRGEDAQLYKQHPFMGADLLAAIPRMKPVAEIIRFQDKPYRAAEGSNDPHSGEGLPLGARILKVALDFDALLSSGKSQASALIVLKGRKDHYDPNVLEALIRSVNTDVKAKVMAVGVADLQDDMILVEDVHTSVGELLASKGQAVTPSMRMRFHSLGSSATIKEPLTVVHPKQARSGRSDPGEQAVSHFVQKLKAS